MAMDKESDESHELHVGWQNVKELFLAKVTPYYIVEQL